MRIQVTHDGMVEINEKTYDPLEARSHALALLEAADNALTQQARNYAFTTNQRINQ